MRSSASLLATALVLVHMAFVAFVVVGGLLTLRWPRVAWVHVPAAVWGALIALVGWICPLTPLENRLREAAGEAPYTTGFLEHYLLPILYPAALTRELQIATGLFVVAVNVVVYWRLTRRATSRWHSVGTSVRRTREVHHVQESDDR